MSVKLEAGQWYRTLANQIVKCIHVHPNRGYLLVFKDGSCGYYPPDQAKEHLPDCTGFDWEPPKPQPKYRPFANAEEFKPYRDKWIMRQVFDSTQDPGCCSVIAYNNEGVWFGEVFDSYHNLFWSKRTFEDGTPFGVRIDD